MDDEIKMKAFRNYILTMALTTLLVSGISAQAQIPNGTPGTDSKQGRFGSNPKSEPASKLPGKPSALNPATLRLMEMIEKKNRELKKRETGLLLREKNLELLEQKVRADLKKIEDALIRSEEQVGIKRDLIEKNIISLVKIYSAMKPQEASTLLENLDQAIAIQIISRMKSKVAGKIMGKMDTRVAKNISESIAGKPKNR